MFIRSVSLNTRSRKISIWRDQDSSGLKFTGLTFRFLRLVSCPLYWTTTRLVSDVEKDKLTPKAMLFKPNTKGEQKFYKITETIKQKSWEDKNLLIINWLHMGDSGWGTTVSHGLWCLRVRRSDDQGQLSA